MRTCLVGQSKLFRAGLSLILRDTAFAVSEEAVSLGKVRQDQAERGMILVHKPDDIHEISKEIEELKSLPRAPFIVLLASDIEPDQLAASFACGVDGYLLEEISPEALLESLQLVTLGEKVFPSQLAVLMCGQAWMAGRQQLPSLKDVNLSSRELQIVQWLTDGSPNKVIATKLAITEATVKVHIKAILKKLGAQNRTQAAIWAVQKGYSTAPDLLTPFAATAGLAKTYVAVDARVPA
jgi:two-component system, NarL family, nitrate/nitrite response regulator NarL